MKYAPYLSTPLVVATALAPYFLLLEHRPPTPGWQFFRFFFLPFLLGIVWLLRSRSRLPSTTTPRWDLLVCLALLIWSLSLNNYLDLVTRRAFRGDTGWVVQAAIDRLFHLGLNPYQQSIQTTAGSGGYNGFHYGPLMLLGYAAVLPFPEYGLVYTNVALSGVIFLSLALLSKPRISGESWLCSALLACLLVWVIPQFRFQLFVRAGPDALPTALIVVALVAVDRSMWLGAGIAAGLAFAAKFAPAIFLLLLLARRDISWRFFVGVALGTSIALPFLWHDTHALWMNSVWFHFFKPSGRTSIYPYLPTTLHLAVRCTLGGLLVFTLLRAWRKPIDVRELTFSLLCIMTIAELGSNEVHLNHFVWFMPLFALLFTWHRNLVGRSTSS